MSEEPMTELKQQQLPQQIVQVNQQQAGHNGVSINDWSREQ